MNTQGTDFHTTGASTVAEYEEHLDERAKMVFR